MKGNLPMTYILSIVLITGFVIWSYLPSKQSTPKGSFLGKGHTTIVRALMAIAIVMSHIAAQTDVLSMSPNGRMFSKFFGGGGALGVALFFFLSGYGNHFSIEKVDHSFSAYVRWVLMRFVKIIIVFILSFVFDTIVLTVKNQSWPTNILKDIVTLSMPGTTTWYLKIQLLYYVILAVAAWFLKERKRPYLFALIFASIVVSAPFYLLNSNWWNGYTGLCFVTGVIIGIYNEKLCLFVENRKYVFSILALFGSAFSYLITIYGWGGYFTQIIVYPIICILLMPFTYGIRRNLQVWKCIGTASLPIYLIHIGLIRVFFADRVFSDLAFSIFILITLAGSFVVHYLSNRINSHIGIDAKS